MFGWFLLIAALGLFYILLRRRFKFWQNRGVPQCSTVMLLGDSLRTLLRHQSFAEMIQSLYNRFPNSRYFGFYQFATPVLLIRDVDLIKQITVKDFDHFLDHRPFLPDNMDPLWTRNLFQLTGKEWRDMRITLSPSFTSSKMKFMFGLIDEAARNFADYFDKNTKGSLDVELKDVFTRFTNDIIATTAFGIKIDSMQDKENDFYQLAKKATDFSGFLRSIKFFFFVFFPAVFKVFRTKFFDDDVRNFFVNVITDNIRTREEKKIVRPDMIHLLMETRKGNQKITEKEALDTGFATVQEYHEPEKNQRGVKTDLTDIDLCAQAMVFIFGGFDTVSSLMCFMGYELAVNPDIQNRLRNEIRETLQKCDGKLTYQALFEMKYLDMVVSETLRKWPQAIFIDRICTKPYTIKSTEPKERDLHIPVGTQLGIPIWGLHYDPKYFPNPEKFDPERFSEANQKNIHPYAYLPFGSGPRNCIGSRFALLETKIVMFHLLNKFEIVPTKKSVVPLKISRKQINLMAQDDFWFAFKKIDY